jgi:hypothetical protein
MRAHKIDDLLAELADALDLEDPEERNTLHQALNDAYNAGMSSVVDDGESPGVRADRYVRLHQQRHFIDNLDMSPRDHIREYEAWRRLQQRRPEPAETRGAELTAPDGTPPLEEIFVVHEWTPHEYEWGTDTMIYCASLDAAQSVAATRMKEHDDWVSADEHADPDVGELRCWHRGRLWDDEPETSPAARWLAISRHPVQGSA